MLNEKELTMARELASELVVVQEKKTKESVIQSIKTLKEALTDLYIEIKINVMDFWEALRYSEVLKHEKKILFNNIWHVPISNLRDSQVIFKAPHMPNIRNSI